MNNKSLPFDVQARILEDHMLIADANIGDDEVIVLEWRISFEKLSKTPFAFMPTSKKRAVRQVAESRLPEQFASIEESKRMDIPIDQLFLNGGPKLRVGLCGL